MESHSSFAPRWIARFALATAVLTWFLIIVGGIVHGTGSSLACPDWPTCYGTFFPVMKGGVFFEHSHRIVAATVGFLSVCLCLFLLWKGKGPLRTAGVFAVLLVIFQGVLGGLTVIYRLPTAVSTAHLATSMLFLALMVWIAFRSFYPQDPTHSREVSANWNSLRFFLLLTAILVYLQVVLGGLVRHTGAGLACVDIPLCRGSLWPAGAPPILMLHMAHRIMALCVATAVFLTSGKVYRRAAGRPFLKFLALSAILLVLIQIALGLLSVHSLLALTPVTAHLAVGALLWVNLILLNLSVKTAGVSPLRSEGPSQTEQYLDYSRA